MRGGKCYEAPGYKVKKAFKILLFFLHVSGQPFIIITKIILM